MSSRFYNKILLTLFVSLLPFAGCSSAPSVNKVKKVLYVTHEPGRWHKYTPQKGFFQEISDAAGWETTVCTGSYDELIEKMKAKAFAKGYDAIVYNFCLAKSKETEACSNAIAQTREHGVPALLIHCSMHSFWSTYANRDKKAKYERVGEHYLANTEVVADWKRNHSDKPFPIWGTFTGIASDKHGPSKPIKCIKVKDNHPALHRVTDGFTTGNTELYNNVYVADGVVPILRGEQIIGKGKLATAIILWESPQGKSKSMGFTLGHDVSDWSIPDFRYIIEDSVNYLINGTK